MTNIVGVAEYHVPTWILALHELSVSVRFLVLLKFPDIPLPVLFSFKSKCLQTDEQEINSRHVIVLFCSCAYKINYLSFFLI